MALVRERALKSGNGRVMFRDEIMRHNPVRFTDVMRQVSGVQLVRTPGNPETVRLRENRCTPLYWLDGQPLLGVPFDPNTQPPNTIEAIEIYASVSLVPPQFQGPSRAQGCGSIVIWTRQGEYRPRRPRVTADSLLHLLDGFLVYDAASVDQRATVRKLPEPVYPDSLRAAGVAGSAVMEFVIDADGQVDPESIGVVSATHPLFADAVRAAIEEGEFTAARKDRKPVAQVYHLPVTFAPRPTPP
jgi:TonB family protein